MTSFYDDLPRHADFDTLVDPARYVPLPEDWLIGVTDVVNSTGAIAEGRYKSVNMAGATVIAALSNALGGIRFPFVFGGDGAHFAVPDADAAVARRALGESIRYVEAALGLTLRAALVPVSALRAAGREAAVARFAASGDVSYAMFRGGGLEWAEAEMKRGAHAVAPAAPDALPDLTGLTCRWDSVAARHGTILSLIVLPVAREDGAFRAVVQSVLALAASPGEASRPVADPDGLAMVNGGNRAAEALTRPQWRRAPALIRLYLNGLIAFQRQMFARNWRVGGFDPARYRRDLVANADYRKYDDGLRLTLDCTPALADRIERLLDGAEKAGDVRFGLHRQATALMTCFVPGIAAGEHVHFIDGADGGYAEASRQLKAKVA